MSNKKIEMFGNTPTVMYLDIHEVWVDGVCVYSDQVTEPVPPIDGQPPIEPEPPTEPGTPIDPGTPIEPGEPPSEDNTPPKYELTEELDHGNIYSK